MLVKASVLRVFANENGEYGNPVAVIKDEKHYLSSEQRQKVASKLNFSETVFINNLNKGNVQIFNPIREVAFAGHALVGTSAYINSQLNKPISEIICKKGVASTWRTDKQTWIQASLEGTPSWNHVKYESVQKIEKIDALEASKFEHTVVWSWIDQENGVIRARTFAPDWGIPEDEANGSGSMQLASQLGLKLTIHHGKGSLIYAEPDGDGYAKVGGDVVIDPEMREVEI